MTKSVKYLRAAKLIPLIYTQFSKKNNHILGCCCTLDIVGIDISKFKQLFKPELEFDKNYFWFGNPNNKNQLTRTLALLLMYEMGEK